MTGRKLLYWAPFMAMGPLTGPLVEGVVRSLRNRRPVLAGLYALAAVEMFLLLPALLAAAVAWNVRTLG